MITLLLTKELFVLWETLDALGLTLSRKWRLNYVRLLSKSIGWRKWLLQWDLSLTYLTLSSLGLVDHGSKVHLRHWIIVFIIIIVVSMVNCIFSTVLNMWFKLLIFRQIISPWIEQRKNNKENNQLKECELNVVTCEYHTKI